MDFADVLLAQAMAFVVVEAGLGTWDPGGQPLTVAERYVTSFSMPRAAQMARTSAAQSAMVRPGCGVDSP